MMFEKKPVTIDVNPLSIYLQSIKKNTLQSMEGGNSKKQCSTSLNKNGIFEKQPRIIAIGDIHGDFEALFMALYKAKCINLQGRWTGENTYVVQLGDFLDKGGRGQGDSEDESVNEELIIIQFLNELDTQAKRDGGRVLCILGNHELMNIVHQNFDYVTNKGKAMNYHNQNRSELLKPGGIISKQLACQAYAIIRIGDWVFVHAGLLSKHLREYKESFFGKINKVVKTMLLGGNLNDDARQLLEGSDSIFWTRMYTKNPSKCEDLDTTFNILKLDNGGIVVGHQIQDEINSTCNDRIWFADTGMSEAFGKRRNYNRIQVLEINNNGEPKGAGDNNQFNIPKCEVGNNQMSCKQSACKDGKKENCNIFIIR